MACSASRIVPCDLTARIASHSGSLGTPIFDFVTTRVTAFNQTDVNVHSNTRTRTRTGGSLCTRTGSRSSVGVCSATPLVFEDDFFFQRISPILANGIPGCQNSVLRTESTRRRAKFRQFQPVEPELDETATLPSSSEAEASSEAEEDTRDDRVLPESLEGALLQAGASAAYYCNGGGTRAIVDLQLPELENLSDEGSQYRLWDAARLFLDTLQQGVPGQRVKAIFPDAGSAAMLANNWGDTAFGIDSLNARRPVEEDDDVVVIVAPGHQPLAQVQKIAADLVANDGPTKPLIMWNPRLISGDVGVGLNVRRLREQFLCTFMTVYCLRPLATGAIYRNYPEPWLLFRDDPKVPGRYLLMKQQGSRPDSDDIDDLLMVKVDEDAPQEPSAVAKALGVFSSFSRFMTSLTK